MYSWLKYLLIGFIFVIASVMVVNAGFKHENNVSATQEVQIALKSALLGDIRENSINVMDKKALVSNLVIEVAKTQQIKGRDIKIDYVFLDSVGRKTEDENNISGIQFRVQLLEDGEIKSTSTERINLYQEF